MKTSKRKKRGKKRKKKGEETVRGEAGEKKRWKTENKKKGYKAGANLLTHEKAWHLLCLQRVWWHFHLGAGRQRRLEEFLAAGTTFQVCSHTSMLKRSPQRGILSLKLYLKSTTYVLAHDTASASFRVLLKSTVLEQHLTAGNWR